MFCREVEISQIYELNCDNSLLAWIKLFTLSLM